MYIGEASKQTGLSIKAIRFYEEIGLIERPQRVGRYRVYQASTIELLVLIKEAKALGIPLAQLKSVIIFNNGTIDWATIKLFLAQFRAQLVQQIDDITLKINALDQCYQQIKS